jgi:pimeloyl-ACP methyl ester carboxylesterase
MARYLLRTLAVAALALMPAVAGAPARAATSLVPAYSDLAPQGPAVARGVVVYSHGRSLTGEDMESPPPRYLAALARAGWDVVRFNRPSREDRLDTSSADLVRRVHALREAGYRRVVLAGHSFGGFLSLMAAARSDEVDSVLAIAPAAFGSYLDSYDTWQMNASELYRRLSDVRHTRVLLAFFHGDEYDPGGRGDRSRRILAAAGVPYVVIDQPRDLTGHLAGGTDLFVSRYGACLRSFIEDGSFACDTGMGAVADSGAGAAQPASGPAPVPATLPGVVPVSQPAGG